MDFIAIDTITQMTDQLLTQYKDSPNFQLYLEALVEPFQELEDVFQDIMNLRMLENATGVQLEINGELVAQERSVYDASEILFFGMDSPSGLDPVPHAGLGDLDDPSVGGVLRSIEQPYAGRSFLIDDDYREFIRAKASKNAFRGGLNAVLEAITYLIPMDDGESVEGTEDFTTPSDPFVLFNFHKVLSVKQKSFIQLTDILPRGGGIRYEYTDTNGPF